MMTAMTPGHLVMCRRTERKRRVSIARLPNCSGTKTIKSAR
jgi:hypothetical protein